MGMYFICTQVKEEVTGAEKIEDPFNVVTGRPLIMKRRYLKSATGQNRAFHCVSPTLNNRTQVYQIHTVTDLHELMNSPCCGSQFELGFCHL